MPVDLTVLDECIAVLTLNNPPLNLNTLESTAQVHRACEVLAADTGIRAVIVTGAGTRAFCAGSDISEFAGLRDDVVGKKLAAENAAWTALENLPQPTIAAINAHALGGGAEIALACTLRVMDEVARIGFPEVNLGLFPGSGGVFRLPPLVGLGRAYELLLTGEAIDARRAEAIGLVTRVAPRGQAFDVARALARTLASRPALALTLMKSAARESLHHDVEAATSRTLTDSRTVFAGPDFEEGVAAFFAKRPAVFTAPRPSGSA